MVEANPMTQEVEKGMEKIGAAVSKPIMALIAIVFGILVIVFKELFPWIVGPYFIIQGILFFIDYFELRRRAQGELPTSTLFFFCLKCNVGKGTTCRLLLGKRAGLSLKLVKNG
jgi:uncharacterized membrane protein HdeD (DUF308 family)